MNEEFTAATDTTCELDNDHGFTYFGIIRELEIRSKVEIQKTVESEITEKKPLQKRINTEKEY